MRSLLFLVPLALMLVVPLGASQSAPNSLVATFPVLYLKSGGRLNATEGEGAGAACVGLAPPNAPGAPQPTVNFALAAMPFAGSWTITNPVSLTVKFRSAVSSGQGTDPPPTTSGFTATADLTGTGKKLIGATNPLTVQSGATVPAEHIFTFPGGGNGSHAAAGTNLGVTVTFAAASTSPLPVTPAQNVAISCDGKGTSKVESFQMLRGAVGDLDSDGDGLPDQEDLDDDNDGFADTQEAGIQCQLALRSYDFSKDPTLRPDDHDGDGDGGTDVDECAGGYDPTSALSKIPPPKPFPWGLLILGLIVLGLAAGLYFFVTTFGKALALTVVSSPELFIPAGAKGKYQVEARSLRKKGDPTTWQLAVAGLPEGWDAKLSVDHVILESVGTGRERAAITLTVEAPDRKDPESAVVVVKAFALNKAGRKDTTKLPARCRTITSINVPPGAKVPVRRGGTVKMKTEEETAKEDAKAAAQEAKPEKGKAPNKGKESVPEPKPTPAPAGKPQLQVGGLTHEPPAFREGETVKSRVTVNNKGADSQTIKLSLFVNEGLADAQTVTVKPGKSKDVKFKWTAQERNKLNIRGELVGA